MTSQPEALSTSLNPTSVTASSSHQLFPWVQLGLLAGTSGLYSFFSLAWLACLALTAVLGLYAVVAVGLFLKKSAILLAAFCAVITVLAFPFHYRAIHQLPPRLLRGTSFPFKKKAENSINSPVWAAFPWETLSVLVQAPSHKELALALMSAFEANPRFKQVQWNPRQSSLKATGFRLLGVGRWVWPGEVVEINWQALPTESEVSQIKALDSEALNSGEMDDLPLEPLLNESMSEGRLYSVTLKSRVCLLYPCLMDGARNRQNVLHLLETLQQYFTVQALEPANDRSGRTGSDRNSAWMRMRDENEEE